MQNAQNISCHGLACRRGGRVVFRDVDLTVGAGEVLLVTGPNGSGKSTLLRALAGLIAPVAGAVQWQSGNIVADAPSHRARLHYIGHLDAAKPALTVRETLGYWQALRGGGAVDEACLDAFGLRPLADRPVRSLSAGQKRRLALTRLVLSPAPLWLLDEPSTALDAKGRGMLDRQIVRHRAGGGIVIAASHDDMPAAGMRVFTLTGAA